MYPLKQKNQYVPSVNFSILDHFFNEWPMRNSHSPKTYLPKSNVWEQANAYVLELQAPGFEKEDFKIEILDKKLVVSAKKAEETQEKEGKYVSRQFTTQAFEQAFKLPNHVEQTQIGAQYTHGILKIYLPKIAQDAVATVQTIEVQ